MHYPATSPPWETFTLCFASLVARIGDRRRSRARTVMSTSPTLAATGGSRWPYGGLPGTAQVVTGAAAQAPALSQHGRQAGARARSDSGVLAISQCRAQPERRQC